MRCQYTENHATTSRAFRPWTITTEIFSAFSRCTEETLSSTTHTKTGIFGYNPLFSPELLRQSSASAPGCLQGFPLRFTRAGIGMPAYRDFNKARGSAVDSCALDELSLQLSSSRRLLQKSCIPVFAYLLPSMKFSMGLPNRNRLNSLNTGMRCASW